MQTTLVGCLSCRGRHIRGLSAKALGVILRLEQLADHFSAVIAGVVDNLLGLRHEGAPIDVDAGLLIVVDRLRIGQRRDGAPKGVAPPGRTLSSTAARVAFSASSTQSFLPFTSTSVAPPTGINSINCVRAMGHRDGESASAAGKELRRMGRAFFGDNLDRFR